MPSPPVHTSTSYGFRKSCAAVRAAVSLEEIAGRYTTLERLGSGRAWFVARCPMPDHEDRTASFYIYPGEDGGRFHCYGCGRGGDVIDLAFLCGGYAELWEAMIALALEFDVKLPERPRGWHVRQRRQARVRDGIRRVRVEVLRRRLFRTLVLPLIRATTGEDELRREVEAAWAAFESVPVEDLLDRVEDGR